MQQSLSAPQAHMTVSAYAKPKEFLSRASQSNEIKNHLRVLFLISKAEGKLTKINHLDKIKALPSFYDIKIRVKDQVHVTEDYDTSPGLIYLRNKNKTALEEDYHVIRELESSMYETA
jgi:hypothetical protein